MTRRTTFLILVVGFLFGESACGGGAKSAEGKAPASNERKPIPADLRAAVARSESLDSLTLDGPRGRATLGLRPAALIRVLPGEADPALFHRVPER